MKRAHTKRFHSVNLVDAEDAGDLLLPDPVDECLLEDQRADAIIRDIRSLLKSFKIMIYNEDSGYGLLRHVMVRTGFASGEIMVVLVCVSPVFPSKNNFVKALRKLHPEITTIVLNVNDRTDSMVLGKRDIVLFGRGYIEDELCGCTFRISPQSFYQVNPVQTKNLYEKAISLAGLTGNERVMDAYCGIGTIGLIASRDAREVISVELNPDAVRDAVTNAKRNQIKNVSFYQNDAGAFMVSMAEKGEKPDIVFMPAYFAEGAIIMKQARELGATFRLMGADAMDNPDTVKLAGKAAEGFLHTTFPYDAKMPNMSAEAKKFTEAWNKAYPEKETNVNGALGYNCLFLIVDAIKRANSAEPAAITKALAATKNLVTPLGTLTINASHDAEMPVGIIEYKDGKRVYLTEVTPK